MLWRTERTRKLPDSLTSYDLLKSFALITMIIDHIGVYLFPEKIEWRILGRMSLPVWMFLVGYAHTREITPWLILSALLLVLSEFVLGRAIFPLNILFTILLARLLIDRIMQGALESIKAFWFEVFLLAVVMAGTLFIFEYGTHAFLFSMLGYLVRHRVQIDCSSRLITGFLLLVCLLHAVTQAYFLEMNPGEASLTGLGILCVGAILYRFKATEFPQLSQRLGLTVSGSLKLMGRHSLEIYVAHLLILKMAAAGLFWQEPKFFQWSWF